MNRLRLLRARYGAVTVAAVVGTLVTLGAFMLLSLWEYRVAEIDFHSRAVSYIETVNAELDDASTLSYTLAARMSTSDRPVSAREFIAFSKAIHRHVNGLRDTGWAPRVTLAERPAFERAARAAGLTGYQIGQMGAHHQVVRAGSRPVYYALLYSETGGVKRAVLGFDLISEKRRAEAAQRAVRTGAPAATAPMDVLTVATRGAGVLSYLPVYESARVDRAGNRPVRGLVLGVFDINELIGKILTSKRSMANLNLYLYNPAAPPESRVVYRSPAAGSASSERALLAHVHWQTSIRIIDHDLVAIVTPAQPVHVLRLTFLSVVTVLVGFTVTTMNVIYMLRLLRRTGQLEVLTTKLNETNDRVTQVSLHDALTGLPNRLLFADRIEQAVAGSRRSIPFVLLLLDLDRFKAVNDTLGHNAGDRLLCAVSDRITASMREVDTAARLGGDEFAIILPGAEIAAIALIANRLIANISKPYTIDGRSVVIGVSVGAAVAGADVTLSKIMREADLALYDAKNAGRGTYRVFEEQLRTRIDEKRQLEHDLRDALDRNELEVHYQPLFDLVENRVSSFEALARWTHPEHGVIPPDQFITVAEECGLIERLGLWVLQTACRDAVGWSQPVKVAVNVSPIQLADAAFVAEIFQTLTDSGLPPARLEIELTEAAVLHVSETTQAMLVSLRERGITIALDDFGTGYSSMSSLLHLAIDKIKIDRSFLQRVESSPSAAALVRGVVELATNLNLTTTAEGVETVELLEHLRSCGCTEAQGYLLSPPRPNSEVPRLLAELSSPFHRWAGSTIAS